MSDDVMDQPWCCLTCSGRFRFGQLKTKGDGHSAVGLYCPKCGGWNIQPADGLAVTLDRYRGERGPLQ